MAMQLDGLAMEPSRCKGGGQSRTRGPRSRSPRSQRGRRSRRGQGVWKSVAADSIGHFADRDRSVGSPPTACLPGSRGYADEVDLPATSNLRIAVR
jgi:hypothetical protein